jgi:hypothetical protein
LRAHILGGFVSHRAGVEALERRRPICALEIGAPPAAAGGGFETI